MLIEDKVQIEAIKTREYMAGRASNTIMFTEGHYIVYMTEKDCLIDISKIKDFPKDILGQYCIDKIESLLKPIKLTNKALIFADGRKARLFEKRETGDKLWIDNKYIKMFQGCDFRLMDMEENKAIAFLRYGTIVGLVLPIIVLEELMD